MAEFNINEQVTVKEYHLRQNVNEIKAGVVVSVRGDSALVQLQGEDTARSFPLDKISKASNTFGAGANFDNRREMPVVKMFPNHR